jgi:hypothetical protein
VLAQAAQDVVANGSPQALVARLSAMATIWRQENTGAAIAATIRPHTHPARLRTGRAS